MKKTKARPRAKKGTVIEFVRRILKDSPQIVLRDVLFAGRSFNKTSVAGAYFRVKREMKNKRRPAKAIPPSIIGFKGHLRPLKVSRRTARAARHAASTKPEVRYAGVKPTRQPSAKEVFDQEILRLKDTFHGVEMAKKALEIKNDQLKKENLDLKAENDQLKAKLDGLAEAHLKYGLKK